MQEATLYLCGSLHSSWQDCVIGHLSDRFRILDPRVLRHRSLEVVAGMQRIWLLYNADFVLAYLEQSEPYPLELFAQLNLFPHKHRIYLVDEWRNRESRLLCEFAQIENVYDTLEQAIADLKRLACVRSDQTIS